MRITPIQNNRKNCYPATLINSRIDYSMLTFKGGISNLSKATEELVEHEALMESAKRMLTSLKSRFIVFNRAKKITKQEEFIASLGEKLKEVATNFKRAGGTDAMKQECKDRLRREAIDQFSQSLMDGLNNANTNFPTGPC